MRRIHPLLIPVVAALWPAAGLQAQPPSTDEAPNPGSRCFRIEARPEVPGRGQRVEFILSPAAGGRDDDPAEEVMVGRMWRTLPTPGDTAPFRAVPAECVPSVGAARPAPPGRGHNSTRRAYPLIPWRETAPRST